MRNIKVLSKTFIKQANGEYKISVGGGYASGSVKIADNPNLRDEIFKFMLDYYKFVINSKLISSESMIYITSIGETPKEIVETFNSNHEEQITTKQLNNHMNYDIVRLQKFFDDDIIMGLIISKDDDERAKRLEKAKIALQNAKEAAEGGSWYDKVTVCKIDKTASVKNLSEKDKIDMLLEYTRYTHDALIKAGDRLSPFLNWINELRNKRPEELSDKESCILQLFNRTLDLNLNYNDVLQQAQEYGLVATPEPEDTDTISQAELFEPLSPEEEWYKSVTPLKVNMSGDYNKPTEFNVLAGLWALTSYSNNTIDDSFIVISSLLNWMYKVHEKDPSERTEEEEYWLKFFDAVKLGKIKVKQDVLNSYVNTRPPCKEKNETMNMLKKMGAIK